MEQPTVLIIAPDSPDRDSFAAGLRDSGCHVETAATGVLGEQTAAVAHPDVVVLPTTLPDADSLVLCQRIRNVTSSDRRPIFLVTPDEASSDSLSSQSSRFVQLAIGVNAMLRWSGLQRKRSNLISCGELLIDIDCHRVSVSGVTVNLTPTEFKLLTTLARDPGRVFTRKQLNEATRSGTLSPHDRTIDVHIKAIRQKMGRHGELIETVHGIGYRTKQTATAPEC